MDLVAYPAPLEARQITFTGDKKEGGIVTDGARLYFQSDGHPVEMSATGGTMQPLQASVFGMKILDISPDASQLLMFKPDLNDETWTRLYMDYSGPRWLATKARQPSGAWRKLVSGWAFARVCRFELGFCQRCKRREFQRNLECESPG